MDDDTYAVRFLPKENGTLYLRMPPRRRILRPYAAGQCDVEPTYDRFRYHAFRYPLLSREAQRDARARVSVQAQGGSGRERPSGSRRDGARPQRRSQRWVSLKLSPPFFFLFFLFLLLCSRPLSLLSG